MQKTRLSKALSFFLCIVLIAAMALCTTSCNDNKNPVAESSAPPFTVSKNEGNVLGVGAKKFTFTVTGASGKESKFEIHTDKKTVGEALLEVGLIAGDNNEYGLYVKTVNGETLDYDKDGKYWAFYVNGAYASAGVDSTNIEAGATYSFKAE